MNALNALIYDIFLEAFYENIKKLIFFYGFLYFSSNLCQNLPKIVY